MDKAALLQSIREAEANATKDLEEARAKKQQAMAAAQGEAERLRRDGVAEVDAVVAAQLAEARRRIDAEKKAKLAEGRARVRRKREQAEARIPEVADFLVAEFEKYARSGLR